MVGLGVVYEFFSFISHSWFSVSRCKYVLVYYLQLTALVYLQVVH